MFFITIIVYAKLSLLKTGLLFGKPENFYFQTLFAPLYEEFIFRGLMFGFLMKHLSLLKAIIFTSLIFGLWHLKNMYLMDTTELIKQIAYAGFVFGPC